MREAAAAGCVNGSRGEDDERGDDGQVSQHNVFLNLIFNI